MKEGQNAVGRQYTGIYSTVVFWTWSDGELQSGNLKEIFHLHTYDHWTGNKYGK